MEFVWLNKQGVASDEGFVLQRIERFFFEYREANRRMRLEGESIYGDLGSASFGFGFYPGWRDELWQPPFHGIPITPDDRARILANIKNAMTFMNGRADFD